MAPAGRPFIAQHELMDTPDKLRTLLGNAGYDEIRAGSAPVAPAEPGGISARHTALGEAGRRFAGMKPATRTDFPAPCARALGLLWRLRRAGPDAEVAEESAAEKRALYVVAVTFFLLAAYIGYEAMRALPGDTGSARNVGSGLPWRASEPARGYSPHGGLL